MTVVAPCLASFLAKCCTPAAVKQYARPVRGFTPGHTGLLIAGLTGTAQTRDAAGPTSPINLWWGPADVLAAFPA